MYDAVLFAPEAPTKQACVRFWAYDRVQAELRLLSELPGVSVLSLTQRSRPKFDLLSPYLKTLIGQPQSGHYARRKHGAV